MLEAVKGSFNVARHGDIAGSINVVPFESETKVFGTSPIDGHAILITECGKEVVSMLFTNSFDTKIVDNKGEKDGASFVSPETGGVTGRFVSILSEVLDKAFVRNLSGLGETVHAFADFNEDMSIVDKAGQLVLFHDASRNGPDGDAHVFVMVHWSVEIEVGDIDAAVGGIISGEGAVDDEFGGGHVSRGCADISRIINEIAANSEADTVRFRLLWTDVDDDAEVGGFAAGREISVFDKMDGLSAFDVGAGAALCKAADFVGAAIDPGGSGGAVEQLAVAEVFPGVGIKYSIGKVRGEEHLVGHIQWRGSGGAGMMVVLDGGRWRC